LRATMRPFKKILFTWPCDLISRSRDPKWPPPKKTLIFGCKSSWLYKKNYTLTKQFFRLCGPF
jgi:hypothetical protein